MKFYKLIYDYENDRNYINCDIGDIGSINEYLVSEGKYIDKWNNIIFKYDSSKGNIKTDYVANPYRWLVVSSKFCSLVKTMIPNVKLQFLPIKIIEKEKGFCDDTYQVINILETVDALDLEHSLYDIFELDDEKIISVEKYALKKEMVEGKVFFRLKNDTIPIFVSETVKEIVENNKLLGFDFLEIPTF